MRFIKLLAAKDMESESILESMLSMVIGFLNSWF